MKRVISIILAVALLFTLTSGCGKKEVQGTASQTVSQVEVTLPKSTGVKAVVEGEAVIATQTYLLARAYFEKLEAYDTDSFNAQEYSELLAKTAEAFRIADAWCDSFEKHAGELAVMEENGSLQQEKAGYEQVSMSDEYVQASPFAMVAYAAEEKSAAVKYAEELTKTFDNAKNGQKLKAVAEKYGTDVKKAKAMLDQAQAILEGAAYEDQADFENKCYQVAVETKAAASTIGFGVGCAAMMGTGFAAASFIEGGGLIMNGVSAVIDTGTAVTVHMTGGEGDEYTAAWEKTSAIFAPASAIFAIGGGIQNIKDFRDPAKAKDMVDNAAQAFFTGLGFARDYVQEGTVLGVSADVIDGYRKVIVSSAPASDADAVKEVLQKTGAGEEALKEIEKAVSSGDAASDGYPGTLADAYIEAMGEIIDPENPVNVEAIIEKLDEVFPENAKVESVEVDVQQEETVGEDATEVIETEDTSDRQEASEDISGVYSVTELRFVQANIAAPLDERLHITQNGTEITLEGETEFTEKMSGTYDAQSMTATFEGNQSKMIVTFDGKGNLLYSSYNTNDGVLYIEIDASK